MPGRDKGEQEDQRLSFFQQQQLVDMAKKAFLQLVGLLKSATLYPPAHPFLLGSAEQLLLCLDQLFAKRSEASFHFVEGELFFETFSVSMEEYLAQTAEDVTRKGIGGITFQQGLNRDELVTFAYLMKRDTDTVTAQGGMETLLHQGGVRNIAVHAILLRAARSKEQLQEKKPSEIYHDGVEAVKEVVQAAVTGKALNARRLQSISHTMVDNILDNRDALIGLTSIKSYDEYTFVHSVNVAILSMALGAFLSLKRSQIAALGIAGMLHDIGKVTIPREIINKPETLTDQEWNIVKHHPVEGALILSGLLGVGRLAMVSAFEHHQQFDGKGYPRSGDENSPLHPFSKIVAIADTYDAVTSARVYYRIETPPGEAVKLLLRRRGFLFDPVLVKTFVNMVGLFPLGTLLRLNTGEIGLVVHQTRDLLRPRVLLLRDFDGTEKEEVSLLEMESGRYKRMAVSTVDPMEKPIDVNQYFQ